MTIFSADQEFSRTTRIGSKPGRMNYRFDLFMEPVKEEFRNARVLDIACLNGRWSYAALKLGARHVTGFDVDGEQIEWANRILGKEFPAESFEFHTCDMLEFLRDAAPQYDIILCLGILYHTLRQLEVLDQCRRLAPKLLIVDSSVATVPEGDALDTRIGIPEGLKHIRRDFVITVSGRNFGRWETVPSAKMLEIWMEEAGFDFARLSQSLDAPLVQPDYRQGFRVAYHCRPKTT